MRSVPQLRFYFDASVGRGRHLEDLIKRATDADRELGLRDESTERGVASGQASPWAPAGWHPGSG